MTIAVDLSRIDDPKKLVADVKLASKAIVDEILLMHHHAEASLNERRNSRGNGIDWKVIRKHEDKIYGAMESILAEMEKMSDDVLEVFHSFKALESMERDMLNYLTETETAGARGVEDQSARDQLKVMMAKLKIRDAERRRDTAMFA